MRSGGGDPFLSTLSTGSDLHARQESADSGLGLGSGGGGGGTAGNNAYNSSQHAATTPDDFLAAMEDVEITPSENRRGRYSQGSLPPHMYQFIRDGISTFISSLLKDDFILNFQCID